MKFGYVADDFEIMLVGEDDKVYAFWPLNESKGAWVPVEEPYKTSFSDTWPISEEMMLRRTSGIKPSLLNSSSKEKRLGYAIDDEFDVYAIDSGVVVERFNHDKGMWVDIPSPYPVPSNFGAIPESRMLAKTSGVKPNCAR